jgi:integrase
MRVPHNPAGTAVSSIRKRTWTNKKGPQTAWVVDYQHQKRQHIKTFPTKREAVAWRAEMESDIKRGVHTPASKSITVAEAGALWLAQAEVDGLEASTTLQYQQHVNYHLAPFIGDLKLAELTPASVQEFRNRLLREGRSQAMTKKVVGSLGSILAHAMASGRLSRNVVSELARSTGKRQRRLEKRHERRLEVGRDIPGKDELRAMLAAAQGRWRPLIVTAVFTGLRASELRGLRWADVDLEKELLRVRQRADRWNRIGPPKSATSQREVPLAPMVVNALREWKVACPKGELGLVFPNLKGGVEGISAIYHTGLGPLERAAGITEGVKPKYGLHALRHAAASLFIEQQGFTPKRVQALMGHSSIAMTLNTYGHLFPSVADDKASMRQLQTRLVG